MNKKELVIYGWTIERKLDVDIDIQYQTGC